MSRRSFCLTAFAVVGVAACSLIVDTEGLVGPTPTPTPTDAAVVDTGVPDALPPVAPAIGLGNGRGGPQTVEGTRILNAYFTLSGDVSARSTSLALDAPAATSTCPITVTSGVAGTNATGIDAGDPSFGALPLTPLVGVVETPAGGYVP